MLTSQTVNQLKTERTQLSVLVTKIDSLLGQVAPSRNGKGPRRTMKHKKHWTQTPAGRRKLSRVISRVYAERRQAKEAEVVKELIA